MAQRYRAQIGELDISEEAEEIRELLYGIVSEFPSGIDAKYLEEQYDSKYGKTGIGTPLSKDWLRQLQLAGEFEVKEIGGSATVYIVHKDAIVPMPSPPDHSQPEPTTNMSALKEALPESTTKTAAEEVAHTNGTNSVAESSKDDSNTTADVLTMSSDESYFYVRIEKDKIEFEKFLQKMTEFYTEHHKDSSITVECVESNKLYVVLDAAFNWCRILVKDSSDDSSIIPCFFVDYGELRSAVRSSLKKLESSFSTENIKPFAQCFALSSIPSKNLAQLPHLITSTYSNTSQLKKTEHLQIKFKIKETDEKHQYSVITTLDASGNAMLEGPFKTLKTGVQTLSSKNSQPQPPPPIPAENLNIVCREPKEMPIKKEIVHILSATDPDNISIRLEAWYPAPDYLYAAMTRDSENSSPPPKENIMEGKFFAAKFEDGWERVQIIRQSTTTPGGDYWIVYAVDIGYFHLIHREQLRFLTESVSSFNRILLAKCKLNGIKRNETGIWSREIQTAMQDILESASKSTVEFLPEGGWTEFDSFNAPKLPYACGKLTIDGKDFAEKLISMGLANAS